MTDRKLLTIHPPMSVTLFAALLDELGEEFPGAYVQTGAHEYEVWSGTVNPEDDE